MMMGVTLRLQMEQEALIMETEELRREAEGTY
jgi:hypothetical protein